MSKYDELVRKLREVFQIDRPELDFGVYRILNARSTEINEYLETGLKNKVVESLALSGACNVEALQKELDEKVAQYKSDGIDPDTVPKLKELKQKIAELGSGSADHENSVFTHLLTFFSRYYDKGDFISQRRFKGDTYAIPYSGEEVILYWANKDQYYTKSGESFSNYGFKLTDGRSVKFRLISANTAKDNRKDNEKDRLFVLAESEVKTEYDENGDEYELPIKAIEEVDGGLVINFVYKEMPKGTKQDALVSAAVSKILASEVVQSRWDELSKREPTEKNLQRTLLEKCLTNYTAKNLADYFIHKDLGTFLSRELDFYIKNEVLNLDDIQSAKQTITLDRTLGLAKDVRVIARDLISFLDQLENFQKKLWLKKKFVVSSEYCITLDRVPQELYEDIVRNPMQWDAWRSLGIWNDKTPGTITDLKKHPFLMVDTSLYGADFKSRLLSGIEDLDSSIDGLIVNGDNFQTLNLLRDRFHKSVDFIYIDPPYNAKSSEILYKNTFKHSSWLTLIHNRISLAKDLMTNDAPIAIAIDENEQENLGLCISDVFSDYYKLLLTVVHNHKGIQSQNFSNISEFCYFSFPTNKQRYIATKKRDGYSVANLNLRDKGNESLRSDAKTCFYPFIVDSDGAILGVGEVPADDFHPRAQTEAVANGIRHVWPIDKSGTERKWRYAKGSFDRIKDIIKAEPGPMGLDINIYKDEENYKTVWDDSKFNAGLHGTRILNSMIPNAPFDFPKSLHLVYECCRAGLNGKPNGVVLDFFAGSGTTAHAVIKLNRDLGGSRKYVLAEQGDYFHTVLKPRIQKAVYSSEWAEGVPTSHDSGVSHCVKTLKIESYEDTLNNLHLLRSDNQQSLLASMPKQGKEEYLLKYMLDVESRGSLLSLAHFQKPFDLMLKLSVDSAGAYEEQNVDLVETFNYLLGLRVNHIDLKCEKGFATITGLLPTSEKALIIWRDVERVDYEMLNRVCEKLSINPADSEYDVVYINGDHNLPTVFTSTEEDGGITKTLKIRPIEPEFLSLMFNVDA